MLQAQEIEDFGDGPIGIINAPSLGADLYEIEEAPLRAANDNLRKPVGPLADIAEIPGFAYVGTPYTNFWMGRANAAQLAAFYTARLMKRGIRAFSPIAHSHAIAGTGEIDATDHDFWVEMDAPFVEAASSLIVVTMTGWERSRGLAHEIAMFMKLGKPIVYVRPEDI